ncbi:MAG: NAD(P)-binding domain-containing protein [Planctomycetales bacterium]|nr:NAD(P)-binding domain-containing protein [Planctomycetales bacterium]
MPQPSKFCLIGAGPSGLTVAKNFQQSQIPFDCFEREDDVGGNWYFGRESSSVYASTHLISSKRLTEFTDYPMPTGWPPYPSHRQALEYLRGYASKFELYPRIQFNTSVESVAPETYEGRPVWAVRLSNGEERRYRGVVIANGHHHTPMLPEYPGEFSGEILHSRDYKSPESLRGRRVLVVGAGNSGCDIAVDAVGQATAVFHSMRRGYHFLPKFLLGKPIDRCGERLHRWRLPLWLRRRIAMAMIRLSVGSPERYGLPRPEHRLFETHPIVNSQLLYFVGHGEIRPKPDIARLCGDRVRFADGSEEAIDTIVYATGFQIDFPFLDRSLILDEAGWPRMYLNAFHPQHDFLFVAGMIQPDGGLWRLVDYQAQLMAAFIVACERAPERAEWFRRLKQSPQPDLGHGVRYVGSPRHRLEVEYFGHRDTLRRLIRRFGDVAQKPLPASPSRDSFASSP